MTVNERLARLERENRWMRRIVGLVVACCALVLLVAQGADPKVHDILKVRNLLLVDGENKLRGRLSGEESGSKLLFESPDGKHRVVLSATNDYASVALSSDKAQSTLKVLGSAVVFDLSSGEPFKGPRGSWICGLKGTAIWLDDEAGVKRVSLSSVDPSLELLDKTGASRAVVGVTKTVNPKTGAETKHAESTVTLFSAKGDVVWQTPR